MPYKMYRRPSNQIMSLSWESSQNGNKAEASPVEAGEARASQRIPIRCPARLSHGEKSISSKTIIHGRVLNMSESGALIEARRPIPVGSQVRIQANELLVGTAYVRHCTRGFWTCKVGLEFSTPLPDRY